MSPEDACAVFDTLTEKQRQTLSLAANRLTSKQIAHQLGVAPVTIDKRIEAVRSRLGAIPRPDLLRAYGQWAESYDRHIYDPIILGGEPQIEAIPSSQPSDLAFVFEDSIPFDASASWEQQRSWLHPGMKPSDLGVSGRLLVMLGGAVAIMMVAVLSMAFADALMSILERKVSHGR